MASPSPWVHRGVWLALAAASAAAACDGRPSAETGGPPPVPVEVAVLEPGPIERHTEYVAMLRSRRSTTLQPMVEGFVTRILVRSGDRVRPGDPVLEIDASRQRAAVSALESLRAAREADLSYARREAARQRALYEAGASTAQEAELAEAALRNAEAQLRAVEEQIREATVELAYHRVTAPTGGIVGDIPVRVGDRVGTSTVLTTIDTGDGLEIYLRVPVRRAAELKRGLRVQIVDESGAPVAETAVDFVSPHVDEATQTVLAKAPLRDPAGFRPEQQVRARVVWSEEAGLRVPVVAVSRIGGKSFVFVVEDRDGAAVARQRGVRLGPIVGNDYIVLEGLAPGDRLIVAGIQKVRDGTPVAVQPAAEAGDS